MPLLPYFNFISSFCVAYMPFIQVTGTVSRVPICMCVNNVV